MLGFTSIYAAIDGKGAFREVTWSYDWEIDVEAKGNNGEKLFASCDFVDMQTSSGTFYIELKSYGLCNFLYSDVLNPKIKVVIVE